MQLTAALVEEQHVKFAVVLVNHAAMTAGNRDKVQRSAGRIFGFGVPVILCNQGMNGVTYYGRRDIVRLFSNNVYFEQLPWRQYTVSTA